MLVVVAAAGWALFAVGIPFEEADGDLCIGETADRAQQALALAGLGIAIGALVAAVQDKRRMWLLVTLSGVATFGVWQAVTRIAAEANC